MFSAALLVLTAAASALATWILLPILQRRAILDHPNDRASHTTPTPRGGGIAVVGAVLVAWAVTAHVAGSLDRSFLTVLGAGLGLAVVSWLDDLFDLAALTRLVAHGIAVLVGLTALPDGAMVFQGLLAAPADKVLAALAWIWFINLFNFMDGIDGLAGVETGAIGLGVFALAAFGLTGFDKGLLGLALAAAATGFLFFNWHPAKIFLGDVGSVPLGFLLGWLLLTLAAQGLWAAALILPLYYLTDATITLGRRALRGEKVWHAHREHFYQKAHQAGLSHAAVAGRVATADFVLVACALLAASGLTALGLAGAAATVGVLLWRLATARGGADA
jgi:UDP-N-acetylmuramyl pentapeptide phosphotransferase/UDP-N-acetylglucosamine-1-phosphate transferase